MAEGWGSVLQVLLGSVFLCAAALKIAQWETTIDWFYDLGLARLRLHWIGPASECVLAILLVVQPRAGAIAAAVWLVLASGLLLRARALKIGCACFGASKSRAVTRGLFRNAGLVVCALALAATGASMDPSVVAALLLVPVTLVGLRKVAFP